MRLQDGTVLVVDHDGLSAWLADEKSLVQPVGSRRWRPLRELLAQERVAAKYASRKPTSPTAALPLVPPKPREVENVLAAIPREPVAEEAPVRPVAAAWQDPPEPEPIKTRPEIQVLADEPAASSVGRTDPTSTPDDGLPIIPLKPLGDMDEAPEHSASEPSFYDDEVDAAFVERARRGDSRDDEFLRAFAACEAAIRRWIKHLTRPSAGPSRSAPLESHASGRLPQEALERLLAWLSGCIDGFGAWLDRITRPQALPPPDPPAETAMPSTPDPVRREALEPPPTIAELPVLRLAVIDEPPEPGDVYEGESPFRPFWFWTKRIVVIASLVAGGILAALNWESWLPEATQRGQMLATEVDRYAQSRHQSEQRQRVLQAAIEQLPHLTPETIEAVMALSPEIVLEPPQVFRVAYAAEERGLSALRPEEAQELRSLRSALLSALSPAERERVREYDGARAQRVTLPFEDRDMLGLFARGAAALSSRSREHLQGLSGKAIAAGLALPAEGAPSAATGH